MGIILIFFEMSFFVRFLWDDYLEEKINNNGTIFTYLMVNEIVVVFEGLSFSTLLMFHFINFRRQSSGAAAMTTENVLNISTLN